MRFRGIIFIILCLLFAAYIFSTSSCSHDKGSSSDDLISSRSYSGHENDMDANNFVRAYPATVGTRLDNCQTCHKAGAQSDDGKKVIYSPCAQCHLLEWSDSTYTVNVPKDYEDTLNAFGLAYKQAGQTIDALKSIEDLDSDGDSSSNKTEIANFRFPGSDSSYPGQPLAPYKTYTFSQINTITSTEEYLLMNTTKQQYDDYTTYRGVKVADILMALTAEGYDLSGVTGITAIAPDGFQTAISTMTEINDQYPNGTFYQEAGKNYLNLDPLLDCTMYGTYVPAGLSLIHNQEINNPLWMIVAYWRDGSNLSTAYFDNKTGKLEGEGPFRLVVPQLTPSKPDRGSNKAGFSQAEPDDGYNYQSGYDHNAGRCARGLTIIRLDPVLVGYEEYDTSNSMDLIIDKKLVVYGHGITE